jgi:iron complex outermembrane recepter protein
MSRGGSLLAVSVVAFAAGCPPALAAPEIGEVAALKNLSLEQLMNIEVQSVSRSAQPAGEAAAAIHVITQSDIRRSGARSIPEALRLAPNLQVAQTGARTWAISARGFNAPFSNKLLVLIDGRTVYSPLFSGVFWDMQDTVLEDVDRIEVISGPGATLWGANAVNGIINIVTKDARETQGALFSAGGGNEERVFGAARYGGGNEQNRYRAYVKYFDRDDAVLEDGAGARDGMRSVQVGFRFDRGSAETALFTLQGDAYDSSGQQAFAADSTLSGGNLLARWTYPVSATERLQIQAYYDHVHQFTPADFGDDLDTFDFDAQYELDLGARQRLMLGAGYRFTHDDVDNLPGGIAFLPAKLDLHLFNAFVQDEIALHDERMQITLGAKFEHNEYTGLEVQPSVRIGWSLEPHFLWAAVSRAVRTPSRIDRHLYFPAQPPFLFAGGPKFDSESVVASEIGWRARAGQDLLLSASAFFSDYEDIRTTSAAPPFIIENNAQGEIYGVELEATWQATDRWRLRAGYTLLEEDIRVKPGREDLYMGQGELFDPPKQFQLHSSLDVSSDLEFDVWLRYVDRVSNIARGFETVPDYTSLDMRIGWAATSHIDVALVGQNLLEDQHLEFGFRSIERSVFGKVTWRP